MRTSAALLVLVCLAGCGDDGDDGGFDMCEPADGIYEVRYVEKSGDCDLGTFTSLVPLGRADDTLCTGRSEVSDDGCSEDINLRCVDDEGIATRTVGTLRATRENGSAFRGTVMVTVTLPDGFTCKSTFSTTGKKL